MKEILNKKSSIYYQPKKHRASFPGFTLIELLVAIAIIGLLSTLALAGMNIARARAKVAKAQHDLAQLYNAISMLSSDTNAWPGLQAVDQVGSGANNEICPDTCGVKLSDPEAGITDTDGTYSNWSGPYMKKIPLDAWGNEYFFDTDYQIDINNEPCSCGGGGCSDAVVLGSYGPDGLGNNQYNCDDIIKIIIR